MDLNRLWGPEESLSLFRHWLKVKMGWILPSNSPIDEEKTIIVIKYGKRNNNIMKRISLIISILIVMSQLNVAQTNYYFPVQTTIENGMIEGNYDTRTGIQTYFGVPFAKPPVGDLRWKAPQPVASWEGIRACVDAPASAMQATPKPFMCWSKEFMAEFAQAFKAARQRD